MKIILIKINIPKNQIVLKKININPSRKDPIMKVKAEDLDNMEAKDGELEKDIADMKIILIIVRGMESMIQDTFM